MAETMPLDTRDLDGLLAVSGELLAVLDGAGRVLRLGGAWQQVLGLDEAQLRADGLLAQVHPEDRAELAARIAEVGARAGARDAPDAPDEPVDVEVRLRQDVGTHRLLVVRLGGHAGGQGGGPRIYLAARDITEQRRLRTATQLLEQVSEVGSWELDLDTGGRGTWSEATHRLHGTDPATFDPSVNDGLSFYAPAARAALAAAVARLVAEGTSYDLEVPFLPRHGGERIVRTTGHALLREGRVVRAFGTFEDVTERRAAQRGLERLARLTELSAEGVVEADLDGLITYANPQLGVLLGEDRDALIGRSVLPLVCGVDAQCCVADLEESACCGTLGRRTVQLDAADRRFWARVSLRSLADDDGRLQGYTAVISDVDEATRARQELEATSARLARAQRLAGLGHWQQVGASGMVEGSSQLSSLLGFDLGQGVEHARFRAAVHPEDWSRVHDREAQLRVGDTFDSTHRIVRLDGTQRVVHEVVARRVDEWGVQLLEGTVHDVTDVHATEQALRASEAQLQRVLTATNDGWWEADLVANQVTFSPRWFEMHGRDPDELVDPWQIWHGVVHPDDVQLMEQLIGAANARGEASFAGQFRVRHGQGHDLPVLIRGLIEYDDAGQPVRISGTTSDRTEALRAEAAKERFVATVSHELRTPLTAIAGAIELLATRRQGRSESQVDELLALAGRNTWRLRGLIDDLLDAEQLRRGGLVLAPRPMRLADLLRSAVVDQQPTARAADVELACRFADPGLVLEVDPRRIGQVVTNLVANAIRFAPRGSAILLVTNPVSDGEVRVDVLDQGPGIPEQAGEDVFGWFVQADPSDTRSHGGTGLGLAICRDVVTGHRGRIGYERRLDTTCLWFTLPV